MNAHASGSGPDNLILLIRSKLNSASNAIGLHGDLPAIAFNENAQHHLRRDVRNRKFHSARREGSAGV